MCHFNWDTCDPKLNESSKPKEDISNNELCVGNPEEVCTIYLETKLLMISESSKVVCVLTVIVNNVILIHSNGTIMFSHLILKAVIATQEATNDLFKFVRIVSESRCVAT